MTRHLSALVAATAFAAVTSPALGQSVPPPVVTMPPVVTPFAGPAGQGVYQGAPIPYPAGPYAQGSWVWHGEGGSAAGVAYPQGSYGQGAWASGGNGGPAYGYPAGAGSCGCPGYGHPVAWMQVPVQTNYRYSPAIRHDKQVVEQHTVNDMVVESKTVPVRRRTKYVKTPVTKVTKVRSAK
jgi:hypothetical protein